MKLQTSLVGALCALHVAVALPTPDPQSSQSCEDIFEFPERSCKSMGTDKGSTEAKKVPLRVLPLGASITYGTGSRDGNGYREHLRNRIEFGGHDVNMVGTEKVGSMDDADVAAWPGNTTKQIQDRALAAGVFGQKPNVVLLNAGTNDCIRNVDLGNAHKRMEVLLDIIYAHVPGVTIVLSSLLPSTEAGKCTKDLSNRYAKLVEKKKKEKKKIVFADMHDGFITLLDIADGVHPTNFGYLKMAVVWWEAISKAADEKLLTPPKHSRKDAPPKDVNLDFDARVPIPFSVFPSSYRSDAVSETTQTRVEGEVKYTGASHAGREDTRSEGRTTRLPPPRVHGKEESSFSDRPEYSRRHRREAHVYEDRYPEQRYPELDLSRERYHEGSDRKPPIESQLDITEREYRRRTEPSYEVDYQRADHHVHDVDDYQPTAGPYQSHVEQVSSGRPSATYDQSPRSKMGYYDDDGNYHSFRRGVERAADRVLHPVHGGHHDDHHHHHHREDFSAPDDAGPSRIRDGVREDVRIVRPRGGHPPDTVTIPTHFIRIGDLLILQGRPCQVIRITVSNQTGQHRYLGVDLFTGQLHEESSFVSNPSPSVVVQSMLGPVYKTYRILDLRDDARLTAMTETGNVKTGLRVIDQGNLFNRLSDAFAEGRGSVRALVINDGGRELVVDYKVIHGSRL